MNSRGNGEERLIQLAALSRSFWEISEARATNHAQALVDVRELTAKQGLVLSLISGNRILGVKVETLRQ